MGDKELLELEKLEKRVDTELLEQVMDFALKTDRLNILFRGGSVSGSNYRRMVSIWFRKLMCETPLRQCVSCGMYELNEHRQHTHLKKEMQLRELGLLDDHHVVVDKEIS